MNCARRALHAAAQGAMLAQPLGRARCPQQSSGRAAWASQAARFCIALLLSPGSCSGAQYTYKCTHRGGVIFPSGC